MSLLNESLARPLEQLLNRGIDGSTTAASLCAGLEGKTLCIKVADTGFTLRLCASDGKLQVVHDDDDSPADATLVGGPLSLQRLLGSDPESAIRDGSIGIEGDSEVASEFRELFRFARPDPEEELSRLLGDPAAHQIGNAVRGLGNWAARARHSIGRSVAEYLQEESRDLPAPAEVEEFCHQVDDLANDVARAEAYLANLRKRPDTER